MVKKINQLIFEQLDKYDFPEEISDIYELIQQHSEKVHFVKDHNGLKNILFLSTTKAANKVFESPYFSLYTKGKVENTNTYHAVVYYTPEDIYNETKSFFENNDKETLYVGIGFEESEVTNDDYWKIFYLMEQTKCQVVDAFLTLRRFPKWYSELADYPIYIQKQKALLKEMEQNERQFLLNSKYAILNKLSKIIEKDDEEEFNKLCNQMRIINSQLNELKETSLS